MEQTEKKKKYLTPADVAEELGVSMSQVYQLFRSQEFPGFYTGVDGRRGSLRVRTDDFDAWIAERRNAAYKMRWEEY